MTKAIKHLALALALVFSAAAVANPVDQNTALKVAKNFWKSNSMTSRMECSLQLSPLSGSDGLNTFYIFENSIGFGFVMISADDCVVPVLAYSATDPVGDSVLPATAKTMLQWYDRQIRYCVANNIKATPEIAAMWQSYLEGNVGAEKSNNYVLPMLTTQWNQHPIYNNLCPYDAVTHGRTLSGCVAVAMAQALKYWNHPAVGIGTNAYRHETYGNIAVYFNNTAYDWENMPNQLIATTPYTEINAVATLMFHCGASCNMNYGTEGSSAAVNGNRYGTSEYAFKNFFGYKKTLHSISREIFSDSAWTDTLRYEIDHGRPVVYTGYDYSDTNDIVGHAFVCDGYDTLGRFHFNWGWGGNSDGYFYLNCLNPGHVFDSGQRAIIGMEPDSSFLRVNPTEVTIAGAGGTASAMVYSAPKDSAGWTASTPQSWITISRTSGPGLGDSASITITATENSTGQSRNGFVYIAQDSQSVTIYVSQPDVSHSAGGWYGNNLTESEESVMSSTQNMIIIRPESYGNFAPGDKITHLRFRPRVRRPSYNNATFTIKFFRNVDFTQNLAQGNCDTTQVLGRVAYTETYTAVNQDVEQIVTLSVPYTITSAPFWIAMQTSGGTIYKSHHRTINAGDPLQVHYLGNYVGGHVCPAISDNRQYEVEYYFQFMVELGKTGIEQPEINAVPDVKVFPNPTTGVVNFSEFVSHVDVFDNMGRRVLSADNITSVSLSDLRKGLYTMRITTEQGTVLRKVVKQR